ncbi:MAG: hypothetical protein JO146_08765, partial [Candidatus Eremiobacteraeota bacterium]|nr:hypothetical protein [Candidatus Eremiobacteraeota bacterium]
GIPLALELTAALVPQLGLEVLRAQLHEYLSVPSGRPGIPARQQTVRATIEWSYSLLAPKERKLLCEVSVFAGGFTLAGAEVVCGGESLDRSHVLPVLSSLVNKSLVTVINAEDRTRYALLETVRSFALERLREGGTYDSVVRRHAQWFATIADDVENTVSTLLPERARELVPEFDNVRAAVAWSLHAPDRDDVAFAGRILSGLYGLWDHMGRPREHRAWIETALDRIDDNRYPVVTAYLLRDFMIRSQAQLVALEPIDRAILIAERSGDQVALTKVLNVVCQVQAVHGNLEDAERSGMRAYELVIANKLERTHHYYENLLSRSFIRFMQRRIDDARALVAEAEVAALSLGYRYTVIRNYYIRRAEIEYVAGDKQAALALVQQMIDSEFGEDAAVRALALPRIVVLQLLSGNAPGAIAPLRELLELLRDGYGNYTYFELEYAALALALLGKTLVAAKLFGALRSMEDRVQFRRLPMRQAAWDLLCSTLRAELGYKAFDRLGAPGDALSPERMIDEALTALG